MSYRYFRVDLKTLIRFYVREAMKHKDWHTFAIDTAQGVVILRRFERESEEDSD